MKVKALIQGAVLSLMLVTSAFAADISGKWKGESEMNGQKRETNFTFEVKGSELTGTVSGRNGDTKIEDGKVDGNNVTFSVTRSMGGNDMKVNYKGVVGGDEIKFTVTAGERTFDLVAKRATT
jgi:hypothetical protein